MAQKMTETIKMKSNAPTPFLSSPRAFTQIDRKNAITGTHANTKASLDGLPIMVV